MDPILEFILLLIILWALEVDNTFSFSFYEIFIGQGSLAISILLILKA